MANSNYLDFKYKGWAGTDTVSANPAVSNTSAKNTSNVKIPMVSEEAVKASSNVGTTIERTVVQKPKNKEELFNQVNKLFINNGLKLSKDQVTQILDRAIGKMNVPSESDLELAKKSIEETIKLLKINKTKINFENIMNKVANVRTEIVHNVPVKGKDVRSYSERINDIMRDRNCSRKEAVKWLLAEAVDGRSDAKVFGRNAWTALKDLEFGKIFRSTDESRKIMERQTLANLIQGASTEELKELEAILEELITEFPDTWGTKDYLIDSIKEQIRKGGNAVAEQVDVPLVSSRQQNRAPELAGAVEGSVNNEGAKKVDTKTEDFHNNIEKILAKLRNNISLTEGDKKFLAKYNIEATEEGIIKYLNGTFADVLATQIVVASVNSEIETETFNSIVQHNISHQNAESVMQSTDNIAEGYSNNSDFNIEEFNNKMNNATDSEYTEYTQQTDNLRNITATNCESDKINGANINQPESNNSISTSEKQEHSIGFVQQSKDNEHSYTNSVKRGEEVVAESEIGTSYESKEILTEEQAAQGGIKAFEVYAKSKNLSPIQKIATILNKSTFKNSTTLIKKALDWFKGLNHSSQRLAFEKIHSTSASKQVIDHAMDSSLIAQLKGKSYMETQIIENKKEEFEKQNKINSVFS